MIKYSNSTYEKIEEVEILNIREKNAYGAGYAYGMLLKKANNPSIKFLMSFHVRMTSRFFYFLTKRYHNSVKIPKDYLEEMRGYSDSTGIPFKNILFYNNFFDLIPKFGHFCTTISFQSAGKSLIARNTDTFEKFAKFSLKKLKPMIINISIGRKKRITQVSFPFIAGSIFGWNDDGFSVFNHQVAFVRNTTLDKYPTTFITRAILEKCSTIKNTKKFLSANKSNRAVNLLLAENKTRRHTIIELHPNEFFEIKNEERFLVCGTYFKNLKHQDPKKVSRAIMREESAKDLVKDKNDTSVKHMISFLKDTRNGIKFGIGGTSISNTGTFISLVIDMKNRFIYISNGNETPVSLNGKYVKIKMNYPVLKGSSRI